MVRESQSKSFSVDVFQTEQQFSDVLELCH